MRAKRVTGRELDDYERFSYQHDGQAGRVIRTLVENARRLRAAIKAAGDGHFGSPAAMAALEDEAEAIRRERE